MYKKTSILVLLVLSCFFYKSVFAGCGFDAVPNVCINTTLYLKDYDNCNVCYYTITVYNTSGVWVKTSYRDNANNSPVNFDVAGTTYIKRIGGGVCCGFCGEINRTVYVYDGRINLQVNQNQTVCKDGALIYLPAFTDRGITAIITGLPGVDINGNFDPSDGNVLAGTTYTVTFTYTSGICSNSVDVFFYIAPKPSPTISVSFPTTLDINIIYYIDFNHFQPMGSAVLEIGGIVFDAPELLPGIYFCEGTYLVEYTYTNTDGCTESVSQNLLITNDLSFSVLPNVNINDPPLDLSTYVNQSGGSFSGPGVSDSSFYPGQYMSCEGIQIITYEKIYPSGCTKTLTQNINVINNLAYLTTPFLGTDSIGIADPFFDLFPYVNQSGGLFSGVGVFFSSYYWPELGCYGPNPITYTKIFNSACTRSVSRDITLINNLQFIDTFPVLLTTSAALDLTPYINFLGGISPGVFSGSCGSCVVGNIFQLGVAVPGIHTITFTHTTLATPFGCSASISQLISVYDDPGNPSAPYLLDGGVANLELSYELDTIGIYMQVYLGLAENGQTYTFSVNVADSSYYHEWYDESGNSLDTGNSYVITVPLNIETYDIKLFVEANTGFPAFNTSPRTAIILGRILSTPAPLIKNKVNSLCYDQTVNVEANYDTSGLWQYPQIPGNSTPDSIYTSPSNLHILEKYFERKYLLYDKNSNVLDTIDCVTQCLKSYVFTGEMDVLYIKTLDVYTYQYPLISMSPKIKYIESFLIDSMIVLNNPVVDFIADQITGCGPLEVSITNQTQYAVTYDWTFGDMSTGTDINPVHTYQPGAIDTNFYDLFLSATSSYNCQKNSDTTLIAVLPKPVSDFTTDVTVDCAPFLVNFTNISQVDTAGSLHLWLHNGINTDSSFSKAEIYENTDTAIYLDTVILVEINKEGCVDTSAKMFLTVYPEVLISYVTDLYQGCSPLQVSITNQTQNATTYDWIFGDGFFGFSQDPVHVYQVIDVDTVFYYLKMTATSQYGCIKEADSLQIAIFQTPVASFLTDKINGCAPLSVVFANTSQTFIFGNQHNWFFRDGQTSGNFDAINIYENTTPQAQTFFALLAENTYEGCVDTFSIPITVYPQVLSQFVTSFDTLVNQGDPVKFTNNSLNSNYNIWDFGDNSISYEFEPWHYFNNVGLFDIKLNSYGLYGCQDSLLRKNYINVINLTGMDGVSTNIKASAGFTGDQLWLRISSAGAYNVRLISMNGKVWDLGRIHPGAEQESFFDLGFYHLSRGIYAVEIISGDEKSYKGVIKVLKD